MIAVSVFDNETGLPEYDRLVAGMSDIVVTRLTMLAPGRIAVIGNAEILRKPRNIRNLKAIADDLPADYVLLGQLQRGESGLRFITHFIRLRDEAHLKANRP
jgi:TolB-like protein